MIRRITVLTGMASSLILLACATIPMMAAAQKLSYSTPFTSNNNISIPSRSQRLRSPRQLTQSSNSSASNWKSGYKSRVRLISGDSNFSVTGSSYAGIQLQMAPGWKTYWRSPGDAGVPPSFDWSGSNNLKKVSILWPAPKTFKDQYSTSIGYKHEVILPLKIVAKDKSKPIKVKLRFEYGICADICVPVESKLQLPISPRQSGFKSLLSHYRSMVPKTVNTHDKIVDGFSIRKIAVNLTGKKPNIIVDASVPVDTKKAELFIESSNGFYIPIPIGERPSAGNHRRFHIDLSQSEPPKGLIGQTLALTLVGNNTGIVYKHKIN